MRRFIWTILHDIYRAKLLKQIDINNSLLYFMLIGQFYIALIINYIAPPPYFVSFYFTFILHSYRAEKAVILQCNNG